jgi:hypothetical protein
MSIGSVFIPLIACTIRCKELPKENYIVGILLLTSLLSDSIALVCLKFNAPTVLINNVFDICSFIIVSFFYYHLFLYHKPAAILTAGSVVYACSLLYYIYSAGFQLPHTMLWAINGGIVGLYGLLYFVLIPGMTLDRLTNKHFLSYAIINGSFIFYFFFTVLFFMSFNYFLSISDGVIGTLLWCSHNIANTLKNIGLAIGLYYTGRRDVTTTLLEIERIGRERSGEPHDPLWTNALKR